MSLVTVGILGIIVLLLILFFFGMPVGFAMGIVGFASFLLIVIFLYRLGFRILKRTKNLNTICIVTGILAGLTGLFAHQMVDWILRIGPITRTFWLMVGILAAIDRLTKEEEDKKNEEREHTQSTGEIAWPR